MARSEASIPLVFDIGFHRGEDTAFYLARGFRVLAVDANPEMVDRGRRIFSSALESGRLTLLQVAVAPAPGLARLHLSGNSEWVSLRRGIAARRGRLAGEVQVHATTLRQLVREHGLPYYCKIDIEGMDLVALSSLKDLPDPPQFLSVEAECLSEIEDPDEDEEDATAALDALCELGYKKFKLVDQYTLHVVEPGVPFFSRQHPLLVRTADAVAARVRHPFWFSRRAARKRAGYSFPYGASGAFGEMLPGRWVDATTAREALVFHRADYFSVPGVPRFGFWCDLHAARGND